MLDGIAAGEDENGEGPEQVVHWAQTVGSASWLRGLRELVLQRSEFWSDQGEVVLSSRASQLARRLSPQENGTASDDAAAGNPAVPSETAPLLRARHRLSGIVLTDLELQDRQARLRNTSRQGGEPGLADSLGVIQCAEVFHQQACALRDPDMMAASHSRIELAIGVGTTLAIAAEELRAPLDMLRADLVSCTAQETFFRSRRARSAGLEQEAGHLARQALAQADTIPDEVLRAVLRCAALADLREWKAAEAEAQAVEPRLSAIQAAGLWLRLRRPDRAAEHARTIGQRGPDPDHPWELPAIRAELALARGAHDEAVHQARQGLAAYQAHSVRLARDALRASFADDPVVAGLHHAAVLSFLARGGDSAAADSFAAAERGRVGFLGTVGAREAAGTDAAAQETVTNWLAAETRWSAEYEEQAAALRSETTKGPAAGPHSAPRQARIDEVGRALNTAEAEVRRKVPAALSASVTGALPDAAAVAEALPPGVLLLAYHLYDEDLVGWAMTHGTLRAERLNCWQHRVVAAARRFRDWCATGGRRGAESDGRWLSEVLLRPAAAQLANHHRVIVIRPASLSLLPFHALPWDGDVLAATHDVSYLPSATLLARNRDRPPDRPWAELSALLVGDPASDPSHGLAELPGTAAEAVEIARLLPRHRLLTGAEAHRGALLAAAPGCSVLHLATHGFVDELAPNRSRLKLAGHDFLGLADLLVAAHAPQLLMLSACDTGRGTATAGGDVLGLTRAALITGARHAVVSLWPVSDSTGCLVITRTYRQLVHAGTISVGTALARAQREVRELSGPERRQEFRALAEHAGVRPGPARRDRSWEAARDSETLAQVHVEDRHPYHWAPFIHVGV
jgi:CHAT domain-containing protein